MRNWRAAVLLFVVPAIRGVLLAQPDTTPQRPRTQVRLITGVGQILREDIVDQRTQAEAAVALGLRVGVPVHRLLSLEGDVTFQTTGLRGPCTQQEAARDVCRFTVGATDASAVGLSLGAALTPSPRFRLGALFSPWLTRRAFDAAEGRSHANHAAGVSAAGAFIEAKVMRGVIAHASYRRFGGATFEPDSQSIVKVWATPFRAGGSAWSAGLVVPLRPLGTRSSELQAGAASFTMFGITVENDLPRKDDGYTNGVRMFVNEVPGVARLAPFLMAGVWRQAAACPYGGAALAHTQRACRTTQVSVTQTMHTPVRIYDVSPSQPDRPFAGTLFAAVRTDVIHPMDTQKTFWTLGSELQLGVLGPSARAEDTQSFAHWAIATGAARPAGWGGQLHDEPHVVVLLDGTGRMGHLMTSASSEEAPWHRHARNGDFTFRFNTALGTTHRFVSTGAVLRWSPAYARMPLALVRAIAPAFQIASSTPRATHRRSLASRQVLSVAPSLLSPPDRRFRFALTATADARFVHYNRTLTAPEVTVADVVPELGVGAQLEFQAIALSVQRIHRAPEFSVAGRPTIGYQPYDSVQMVYRPVVR